MVSKQDLRQRSKEQLIDMVYDLFTMVDILTKTVESLNEEIKNLKTKKNSSNSSLPPSHDLPWLKNQSLREKSNKKSGGQAGHKGETLLLSEHPHQIVEHRVPGLCPQCGKNMGDSHMHIAERRQVIDIPAIDSFITEHQVLQLSCTCGHVCVGRFPAGVSAPVQYGNNLVALTAYLSSRQYVPYSRLTELIKSITNISLSQGTVFNMLNKAADAVMPLYQAIKKEVEEAPVVGGDETGISVKNTNYWAWTWQTVKATYINISNSRGYVSIDNLFPNGFPNATYVSDSLSAQLKIPAARHQLCLAHLLRELNYFEERYRHKWATDLKDVLKEAIKLKNAMSPEQYNFHNRDRDSIIKSFGLLINETLPGKLKEVFPFQKRLRKRQNHVFNFLYYPEVPYDNNASERAIRNVKVKQKISGSFRSERGADIFAILRSVFDTINKKEGNPFETMQLAINLAASKKEFHFSRPE